MDFRGLKMQNFDVKYPQSIERASCGCVILLGSIFTLSKMWDVDAKFAKGVSLNPRKGKMQIHQLSKKHLRQQITPGYRYIRSQKSKSFIIPPIQSRYTTKQEKTMQSSKLESGLPDEAEQECIVFSCLGLS